MALKDKLLQFMSEHSDELFSGEALADHFHVTRAAVWKSIKQLTAEGYRIQAIAGQGYVFASSNDTLNVNEIYRYSGLSGYPVLLFDTIDSTNSYARRLTAEQCKDGMYIIANEQTAGRGRKGNSFYSPANTGLYVSYVMKTEEQAENLLKLTIAAGVAVCEALEECTGIKPQIKCVNDIYLNRKKIAGILSEASFDFETRYVDSVVIGIGINVTTPEFPDSIKETAGSLPDGKTSRNQLAGVLYRKLRYRTARCDDPELINLYRQYSLLIGKQISYTKNNTVFTGIVKGINEMGNLMVEENEAETVLSSGEVKILSWED